jgi:DNA-binding NarL/FixJ family response regulator
MRRPTILLADDHTIVTDGLATILADAGFDVIGAVRDGELLVDAARRLRPDVIITDLAMPRLSGLDVLARLERERLASKVIVLTMHRDAEVAADAMRGGASGLLLKEAAGDELVAAVRHALEGRVYITPSVTKDVMTVSATNHAEAARHPAVVKGEDGVDEFRKWSENRAEQANNQAQAAKATGRTRGRTASESQKAVAKGNATPGGERPG